MRRKGKIMSDEIEMEYNLLDEPWIKVMDDTGTVSQLGLQGLFYGAHRYVRLAGETRTQDFAILRFLLAILHSTFGRQEDGTFATMSSLSHQPNQAEDMFDRWRVLWGNEKFPFKIIEAYLEQYRERFWLFHPERPFYQIPAQDPMQDNGTYYSAKKLRGTLSESSNKARLFSHLANEEKESMEYSEAARWLIHQISFDDTALKPVTKGRPGPGVGWLGKLGPIAAYGNNLFETLMLNFVMFPDGGDRMWGIEKPIWSLDQLNWSERTPVPIPDNPSEILTLQSRWIHLLREGNRVKGFRVLGGFFYENDEEWFNEQMTLWRRNKSENSTGQHYVPKLHSSSRTLWRDLSALLASSDKERKAGIIAWLGYLRDMEIDLGGIINFATVSINYRRGSPSNEVMDIFTDDLSFSSSLLSDKNDAWVTRILDEVQWTDKLVSYVRILARDLICAEGGSGTAISDKTQEASSKAYFRLDMPFRTWLADVNPEHDQLAEITTQWRKTARKIIRILGQEMVANSGPTAMIGRFVSINNKERLFNAPKAYDYFLVRVYQA